MKNILLSKLTKLALVSSLLFFACSTKASAEVNMKVLNSVIKSCQDNPPKDNSQFKVSDTGIEHCVEVRYHYVYFMSVFNGLKKLGDLREGFPSSIMISSIAASILENRDPSEQFMNCMVSNNSNSNDCSFFRGLYRSNSGLSSYTVYICSSCFEAYSNVDSYYRESSIMDAIMADIVSWFYRLDKPSRKLVVDSLSNRNFLEALRYESEQAGKLYSKIKDKVERETQEQKRRDLLQ